MNFSRTFDLISLERLGNESRSFLFNNINGTFEPSLGKKVVNQYLSYCQFLQSKNIAFGEMIVMMPQSATIEWVLFDLAIQAMGGIVVMAHATLSTEQLSVIFQETESRFFIYQNSDFVFNHQQTLKGKISIDLNEVSIKDEMYVSKLTEISKNVKASDISTIIYTSGTTGTPKGVMLTHANIMTNVHAITLLLPIKKSHSIISFLPYSHIFERTSIYCMLALQCNIYFIGRPQNLAIALRKVKPHFFTAVPRILERMYDQVVSEFQSRKWLGKKVFKWASKVSEEYQPHQKFNPIKFLQIRFIRWFLLGKFRKRLGGNIQAILVGAAHLRPEIAKAFYAAGIKVREGYGMTETSPGITFNRFEPGMSKFGTVGLPLPNVEVEIRDQDESGEGNIWVKGPNVMLGYFKRAEETSKVLGDDGWLSTGDVGMLDYGFLKITDRKKDIFKTSSGKYIAPQELENHFRNSDLIDSIMIMGFQRQYVSALIFPNYLALEQLSKENNIHWTSPQYMVLNIKIQELIQQELDIWNNQLPTYKQIKAFHLMHEAWSIETGQLSNTMKPIRKKIMEDYKKEIDQMYQ